MIKWRRAAPTLADRTGVLLHWPAALLGLLVVGGCTSAVVRSIRRPQVPLRFTWTSDTVVRASDLKRADVDLAAVGVWSGDSLVVSDARSATLQLCGGRAWGCRPAADARFRPTPPRFLAQLDRQRLLAGNRSQLWLIDVAKASVTAVPVPLAAWGEPWVGSLSVLGRSVVMAPWSGGPTDPTTSSTDTATTGLEIFSPEDGKVRVRFGAPVPYLSTNEAAGPLARIAFAGSIGDSLVVVRLFDGLVEIYPDTIYQGARASRSFTLPARFTPRWNALSASDPTRPAAFLQPQLEAAALDGRGRLIVLRHSDYRWRHRNPLRHPLGDWDPVFALEAFDVEGQLLASTPLGPGEWRSVLKAPGDDGGVLVVARAIGGATSDPVMVRWRLRPEL